MVVVTFDVNQYNFITDGTNSYFLFRSPEGRWLLVDNSCQHRGGPLHLGSWDDTTKCVVCPWHGTKHSQKHLQKRAIPLVYSSGKVTAIVSAQSPDQIHLSQTTILANER
jgi:Rieske [2Fe-2S] domain